ncbi:MAG TPA: hypothetical protein GX521_01425 [Firmicutes bacterium]|nr:hypothetical protein [Bacillota bacterium]
MINGLEALAKTIITGNLILVQGLGLYALIRHTHDVKEALRSGGTTFVGMLLGGALLWLLGGITFASLSAQIGYYLLVGAVASVLAHSVLKQGGCLQDRLADSALVGLLLLLGGAGVSGPGNVSAAFAGGLGYCFILVIMATLRQRLELAPIPRSLRGVPILLITAGLLGIALLGFRF